MDTYYSPELKPLIETAERFAAREIPGKVVKLESLEKPEFPWEAIRAGGEAGFLSGPLDEDLGGGKLNLSATAVLIEKLAEGAAGLATIFAVHLAAVSALVAADRASPLLKEMADHLADPQPFLLGIAIPMTVVPLSRPAIPTVETKNGTITVTGDFICLPSPDKCSRVILITSEKNACAFVIDSEGSSGGASLQALTNPIYPGSGLDEFRCAGLTLDDFQIRAGDEITENNASANILRNLRVLLAAAQAGNARAAMRSAWEYAKERVQTGRRIIEHQDVRRALESMSEQVHAMSGMLRLAADAPDEKSVARSLARHAYTFCGTAGEQVCLDAIQTLGGYGYMKDYGIEKRARDAKSLQCILGTYPEDMLGGI